MVFPVGMWLFLCVWIAWEGGLKDAKLPAPYRFWGATGAMAIAAAVGMANRTVGNVLAIGLGIGAFLYYYSDSKRQPPPDTDALSLGIGGSKSQTQKSSSPQVSGEVGSEAGGL